ncbi:MAG: hypothetical protein EP329_18310, partial [Deltaproteobacteria bacterium]
MRPPLATLLRFAVPLGLVTAAACAPYGYYEYTPPQPAYVEPGYDNADDYYDDIEGDPVDSLDEFYAPLEAYGSWYDDPALGYTWTPHDAAWEPYSDGYWTYTRYGWTWVSNRPYGWAVCHYGRWYFDGRWHWVPDLYWGPAWVDWRTDGDYVAWGPLWHPHRPRPNHYGHRGWRSVHRQHMHDRQVSRWYRNEHETRQHAERGRDVARWGRSKAGSRWSRGPRREWVGEDVPTSAIDVERSGRRPTG